MLSEVCWLPWASISSSSCVVSESKLKFSRFLKVLHLLCHGSESGVKVWQFFCLSVVMFQWVLAPGDWLSVIQSGIYIRCCHFGHKLHNPYFIMKFPLTFLGFIPWKPRHLGSLGSPTMRLSLWVSHSLSCPTDVCPISFTPVKKTKKNNNNYIGIF